MEILKVTITPTDFKLSSGFLNIPKCSLWMAIDRQHKDIKVLNVSRCIVRLEVNNKREDFLIPEEWGLVGGRYSMDQIDEWAENAKKSLQYIPTVELELKRVPIK